MLCHSRRSKIVFNTKFSMQHQVTNILHSHFLKDPIRWCNKKSVIFWQNLPPCQFRCWYYTIPAKTIRRITSACPSNSTEWRNSILYQHFKKLHLSMGLALCLRGDLYLFSINTTLYITVNMQMLLGIEICSILAVVEFRTSARVLISIPSPHASYYSTVSL